MCESVMPALSHHVKVQGANQATDAVAWCTDHKIPTQDYSLRMTQMIFSSEYLFSFKNSEQAAFFALKWAGHAAG